MKIKKKYFLTFKKIVSLNPASVGVESKINNFFLKITDIYYSVKFIQFEIFDSNS